MSRFLQIAPYVVCALLAPVALLAPQAQSAPPPSGGRSLAPAPMAGTGTALVIEAGSGRVLPLSAAVTNVFVSDPKIAEVRPASPTSLFLFGVTAGRTTVAAMDAQGTVIRQFEVTVRPSAFGANEAAGTIARTATPGANVRVDAQPKRLVVNGQVATPLDAHAAAATASGYLAEGQTVENRLAVNSQIQVGLKVRIAEISRSVNRALGINWQAIGNVGKYTVNFLSAPGIAGTAIGSLGATQTKGAANSGLIDALATDNLIKILAEPTLVAMSGETASFLVGGEFPIPISQQSNSISVEFKQYGISLAFVPTVLGEDRIRLHVRPEVSQLTTTGAVQISAGIQIPALTVRRADTTIELGSGQSFAIAGLLQDNTNQNVNALPGLGDIPILGALFRSDSFQRNETELVIIVTPYVMRPVNDPTALRLPTDGFQAPNDLERILMLRQTGIRSTRPNGMANSGAGPRLPGQAGFVIE